MTEWEDRPLEEDEKDSDDFFENVDDGEGTDYEEWDGEQEELDEIDEEEEHDLGDEKHPWV